MINETKIAIEYLTELRDSRQKVLPNEAPYYEAEKDMDIFNLAIKALEERPAGKWIKEEDRVHSKCSLCGFKYADYGILFDYCPHCGARMEEENT